MSDVFDERKLIDSWQSINRRVLEACKRAARPVDSVRLVAVSKKQSDQKLDVIYRLGHRDFGENYIQELLRKQNIYPDARWHMIGHLQSNKAKKAIQAQLLHTLDSLKLAKALSKGLEAQTSKENGTTHRFPVLIEVNLANESQKAGVPKDSLSELLESLQEVQKIEVTGLMCIPPRGNARQYFEQLRLLAEKMRHVTGLQLPQLSMGMSSDFEEAIAEGATIIRVGTAIFGERLY